MGHIRQKWQEKPKGFLWYNEQLVQKIKESQYSDLKLLLKESPEPHDRRIESLKQKFNRAQRKALDNPTLENVIKAQRLQKQIMEKSQKFATMWQLASLMDYQLTNSFEPANSLHKRLYQEKLEQNSSQRLRDLSKNFGLIFQVSNQCSYCHAFLPIVQQFTAKYGFQLLLVSSDGANFQNIKTSKDTGLLQRLNPKQIVPVLYLVESSGNRIYPIARGIISEDKMIENILAIDQNYQKLYK
ncbi:MULTISPECIES: conjugal transfer protein TraF [spotted fever group]|uniref:Conjugal pilus assembly protein TraF n=1 Tax=Rickettsia tamurae subsp. buchneri TaxID=1462938 RepID=A0A8E1BZP3_9RICK|nr:MULTISPECIES: conjugal transfer protein TraF [spotted fever group]EER22295.1 F pilus assembly protein TraF [Rickettsia endosymbiont of Ixodes scapularis]KDO02764.1 conjugal pilus assembly protein TraF [Rickettsia tamurae subsp. buchneri]KDO03393.1 conjugal pilus assembly protein TraF [Rickettsia tamurae subsp. buchneri]